MDRGVPLAAAILLGASSASATRAMERTIGRIEAVFEFRGAMPTGVTVAPSGTHLREFFQIAEFQRTFRVKISGSPVALK